MRKVKLFPFLACKCKRCFRLFITHSFTIIYNPGICPHCGNHFLRLKQHIIYKHTTEKPFKCEKCDFAHALPKGLRSHMNTVHPDKKALKMCHICSYKCILSSSLRIHIESVHDKVHPYTTYLITLKGDGGFINFKPSNNCPKMSKNVQKCPKIIKHVHDIVLDHRCPIKMAKCPKV